jgi:hypothetical protein
MRLQKISKTEIILSITFICFPLIGKRALLLDFRGATHRSSPQKTGVPLECGLGTTGLYNPTTSTLYNPSTLKN